MLQDLRVVILGNGDSPLPEDACEGRSGKVYSDCKEIHKRGVTDVIAGALARHVLASTFRFTLRLWTSVLLFARDLQGRPTQESSLCLGRPERLVRCLREDI